MAVECPHGLVAASWWRVWWAVAWRPWAGAEKCCTLSAVLVWIIFIAWTTKCLNLSYYMCWLKFNLQFLFCFGIFFTLQSVVCSLMFFFFSIGFHRQLAVWANYVVALWYAVHVQVRDFFISSIEEFEKMAKSKLHCCHVVGFVAASWWKGVRVELQLLKQLTMLVLFRNVTSMKTSWNGNLIVILGWYRGGFIKSD
jgi:hypothetical protein